MKVWSSTRYIAKSSNEKKIVLVISISRDIFFQLAHFFVKSNCRKFLWNWFHEIFVKLDFTKKLDVANPKYSHCVVCCCPWVLKTLKFREPECGSRWRGSTQKQWFYFFFRGLTEMRQSIEHTKREISDGYLLVFSWNLISRKFREINFTKIPWN